MVYSLILLSLFCFREENVVQFLGLEVSGFKGWSYYFTRGSWSPYLCFCSVHWKGILSMALRDSVLMSPLGIILIINFDIAT